MSNSAQAERSARGCQASARNTDLQTFSVGPWQITGQHGSILQSEGEIRVEYEASLALPSIPEMVFADNFIRIEHEGGFGVEFNALDALKLVSSEDDAIKVAVAEKWREARADSEFINQSAKPFDWTYTTNYNGTLFGDEFVSLVAPTEAKIDMEKLKIREKILFYQDVTLFEDELADNGISLLNVKLRVMPSGFFILLRFFMRVDGVIIRCIETRYHWETDSNFILREHLFKENRIHELKVPPHLLTDMNEICPRLTLRQEACEKLLFPKC